MKRKNRDIAWQLAATALIDILNPAFIIAFALFVGLGYILSLLTPVTITGWVALLWLTLSLSLAVLSLDALRKPRSDAKPFTWRALLPLIIPLLITAPGIYAVAASPTVQMLYHGDLHFGYIHQLLKGSTPPENVFLAGYPANFYWLFHAFEAAIIQITSLRPPVVASALNIAALLSCLLWIGKSLEMLELGAGRSLGLGAAAIFVFAALNATGIISILASLADGSHVLGSGGSAVIAGAHPLLGGSLGKITNINSMDTGVMIFAAALYSCLNMVKRGLNLRSLTLFSACGIVGLAVNQLATVYIVVALFGGLAACASLALSRQSEKRKAVADFWLESRRRVPLPGLSLWLLISLALSLPLLKYNIDMAYNTTDHTRFALFDAQNMAWLWGAFALLLPCVAAQVVYSFGRGDAAQRFIACASLIGLLFGSGFTITINNQYKGFYFLTLLLGISTLLALRELGRSRARHWRRVGRALLALLFLLVFARLLYFDLYLLQLPGIVRHGDFGYQGRHSLHSDDAQGRFPGYYWIRDHAPADAIVLTPIKSFQYANVLLERQLYVKKSQFTYTDNIAAYDERVELLRKLYRGDTALDDYQELLKGMESDMQGRPLYAVVKDAEVSRAIMAERGAQLLFEHADDGGHVYRLNPQP